jgi:putative hydrolase of the HAD superfamily
VIKAVFFDLDDTLFDRESVIRTVIGEQYASFKEKLRGIEESDFIDRVLELDDHGLGDKAALYKTIEAEWNLDLGMGQRLLRHFWFCFERHCRPTEGAADTLRILRARGRKTGVISNGSTERQQRKLACMGIGGLLDTVLISEAEGIRKPDPAIFMLACDRCGVRPNESVFVGDNPEADVAGARAAGMVAIWKRVPWRSAPPSDVLAVDGLVEILPTCLAP